MSFLNRFYRAFTGVVLLGSLLSYSYISPVPYTVFSFTFSFDGFAFFDTRMGMGVPLSYQ